MSRTRSRSPRRRKRVVSDASEKRWGLSPTLLRSVANNTCSGLLPDQFEDDQKQDSPECGGDERANQFSAQVDPEFRKQPTTQECAQRADNEVANQAEAAALHDQAGQIARRNTNQDEV